MHKRKSRRRAAFAYLLRGPDREYAYLPRLSPHQFGEVWAQTRRFGLLAKTCSVIRFRTQDTQVSCSPRNSNGKRRSSRRFPNLLRGPESNRRLEVMSLPRYLSSTPLFLYYTFSITLRNFNLEATKYLKCEAREADFSETYFRYGGENQRGPQQSSSVILSLLYSIKLVED